MLELIYENELGRVLIGGDGSYRLSLCEITGLGLVQKSYTVKKYLDTVGQFTGESRAEARTITMTFDISGAYVPEENHRILSIFSKGGTLTVRRGFGHERKIAVNRTSASDPMRRGTDFRTQTVQMVCDDPYFTDKKSVTEVCYERKNHIVCENGIWNFGSREQPLMWTTSSSDRIIHYYGDEKSEPTFVIHFTGYTESSDGFEILAMSEDGAEIIAAIRINYAPSDGEIITVNCNGRDTNGRYIHSSLNGDISEHRSDDTVLSRFFLSPGKNRIVFRSTDSAVVPKATISFENRYVHGVI